MQCMITCSSESSESSSSLRHTLLLQHDAPNICYANNFGHVPFVLTVRSFDLVCCNIVLRLLSDHVWSDPTMYAVVFLWVVWLSSDIHWAPVWLVSLRWPSQLRRRVCIVVLHSSVWGLVYSSIVVIFLGLGFSWNVFYGKCRPYFPVFWWVSTVRCCKGIHLQHTHWQFRFWQRCWFFCRQTFYSVFWNNLLQELFCGWCPFPCPADSPVTCMSSTSRCLVWLFNIFLP